MAPLQTLTTLSLLSFLHFTSASPAPSPHGPSTPLRIPMRQLSHGPGFNITVGTPPQTMTMLDDWTWHSTWLYTPHCRNTYSLPECVLPGQNYFDYRKSSTFSPTKDADQTFGGTDYTPGAPFTVSFGTDTMCRPNGKHGQPGCQKGIEVEVSNLAFEFPSVEDIGGIIGLAPPLPGFNKTYLPAAYQFFQHAPSLPHIVGWHTCNGLKIKTTCQGEDYLTVYGGTDTAVYDPRGLVYHDIVVSPCINAGNLKLTPARDNYWSASWTGFWIGKQNIELGSPTTAQPDPPVRSCATIDPVAVFDEGVMGRGAPVPLAAFKTLTTITKAKALNSTSALPLNEGKQGLWEVDCKDVKKLPELVYELSGKQKIVVGPEMYVDQGKVVKGKCLLNARTWERGTAGAQVLFGQTVLERSYLRFDFEGLRVGVAPLRREVCR